MSDLIIRAPVIETCGNCHYGKLVEIGSHECWGLPPTPVLFGTGQDMAGRPAANIQLLRPRLPSNMAACALWKIKSQDPLVAASQTKGNG